MKMKIKIKYPTYICGCGRRLVPSGNPSKCPYCGRVTVLKK